MALIAFIIAAVLFALALGDVHPKCTNAGLLFVALGLAATQWGHWPR